MNKKNILLHTCCATCLCYVHEMLKETYAVTAYFYNPNIAPGHEYHKRLKDVQKFCDINQSALLTGEYDIIKWKQYVRPYRFNGEMSERCLKCYEIRFERTFQLASKNRIECVGTTLTISPHKSAERVNRIGASLSQKYGIEFLEADFKKGDGFKKASALSKEYGFYRQNYCGCVYSKIEREISVQSKIG